ncbi:MAG: hypothetical protein M0Z95_10905 [Actinomycetota bacterium]|nr:hypothetical protein [Actinomycetota bacterium]
MDNTGERVDNTATAGDWEDQAIGHPVMVTDGCDYSTVLIVDGC